MTPIYHVTHIRNLTGILSEGVVVCDRDASIRNLCEQSIAYHQIKERRMRRRVARLLGGRIAAGGVLADYVPFYFTNRSPMLGAIHTGKVEHYEGGQEAVIYLVAYVEEVAQTDAVWCFTNGHAVEQMTDFYDDLDELKKVDWDAVKTWRWGGRWLQSDPDILRRKQAEFLVHYRFRWELVRKIAVANTKMKRKVTSILEETAEMPHPFVTVESKWYYN